MKYFLSNKFHSEYNFADYYTLRSETDKEELTGHFMLKYP